LKDVYAENGEFSREKMCVVNESTVDIAEVYKWYNFIFNDVFFYYFY